MADTGPNDRVRRYDPEDEFYGSGHEHMVDQRQPSETLARNLMILRALGVSPIAAYGFDPAHMNYIPGKAPGDPGLRGEFNPKTDNVDIYRTADTPPEDLARTAVHESIHRGLDRVVKPVSQAMTMNRRQSVPDNVLNLLQRMTPENYKAITERFGGIDPLSLVTSELGMATDDLYGSIGQTAVGKRYDMPQFGNKSPLMYPNTPMTIEEALARIEAGRAVSKDPNPRSYDDRVYALQDQTQVRKASPDGSARADVVSLNDYITNLNKMFRNLDDRSTKYGGPR